MTLEDARAENAVTPELRELYEMVTRVKCDVTRDKGGNRT